MGYALIVGARVAIDPGTDLWMRGVRYGNVVKIGRKWVHIASDLVTTHKISANLLTVIDPSTPRSA